MFKEYEFNAIWRDTISNAIVEDSEESSRSVRVSFGIDVPSWLSDGNAVVRADRIYREVILPSPLWCERSEHVSA